MKTVTTSKGTFMFVEVPDGTINAELYTDSVITYEENGATHYNSLPHLVTEIIGQLSTITEDQASSIIETIVYGKFRNYLISSQYEEYLLPLPSLSLKTLIKSEGLDPAKDYVILKINK